MKALFLKTILFLLLTIQGYAAAEYSLAFVHIGNPIPSYLYTTLQQARFMNEDCNLYFFVNDAAYHALNRLQGEFLSKNKISLINVSTLQETKEHKAFRKAGKFILSFREGFWNHVTERFFYIYDFMVASKVENLIQIETDVMLYANVSELMPALKQLDVNVGAPFEWKTRCIASFVFFKNQKAAKALVKHIVSEIRLPNSNYEANLNDMCTLASFREKKGEKYMTPLPIVMPEYAQFYSQSHVPYEHGGTTLEFLSKNYAPFSGYLFDAAALGIYVKGYDRRNGPNYSGGAIHPKSVFDPSKLHLFWGKDPKDKIVPYAEFKGKSYRVINLHFHSKLPEEYTSFGAARAPLPG